jgi:hypothetical protein
MITSKSGIDDTLSYGPNDQERNNLERNKGSTCSPCLTEKCLTFECEQHNLQLLLLCLEDLEDHISSPLLKVWYHGKLHA